jgi:hypothetical protein
MVAIRHALARRHYVLLAIPPLVIAAIGTVWRLMPGG